MRYPTLQFPVTFSLHSRDPVLGSPITAIRFYSLPFLLSMPDVDHHRPTAASCDYITQHPGWHEVTCDSSNAAVALDWSPSTTAEE